MRVPWTDRLLADHFRRQRRGFYFLLRLRHRLGGAKSLRARTRYGGLFDLQADDYIAQCVLREGYYESEVLEALRPFLTAGAVFWDVGANFGLHAITAKLLAPAATVIAFEPNPAVATQLQQNAGLNRVDVIQSPLALSANRGPQTFHVAPAGNSGMSTLRPYAAAHFDHTITVQCARGDDLVSAGHLPAPTVIKIDVEGGEADVISGLGSLLANPALRAIVFEADRGVTDSAQVHPVAGPLLAAGFRLRVLRRREATQHLLENYVAVRESAS